MIEINNIAIVVAAIAAFVASTVCGTSCSARSERGCWERKEAHRSARLEDNCRTSPELGSRVRAGGPVRARWRRIDRCGGLWVAVVNRVSRCAARGLRRMG